MLPDKNEDMSASPLNLEKAQKKKPQGGGGGGIWAWLWRMSGHLSSRDNKKKCSQKGKVLGTVRELQKCMAFSDGLNVPCLYGWSRWLCIPQHKLEPYYERACIKARTKSLWLDSVDHRSVLVNKIMWLKPCFGVSLGKRIGIAHDGWKLGEKRQDKRMWPFGYMYWLLIHVTTKRWFGLFSLAWDQTRGRQSDPIWQLCPLELRVHFLLLFFFYPGLLPGVRGLLCFRTASVFFLEKPKG